MDKNEAILLKDIQSILHRAYPAQNIDLIWKKRTIRIKTSSKKVGNSFIFSNFPATNAEIMIFVGYTENNPAYFWVKPATRFADHKKISLHTEKERPFLKIQSLPSEILKISYYKRRGTAKLPPSSTFSASLQGLPRSPSSEKPALTGS